MFVFSYKTSQFCHSSRRPHSWGLNEAGEHRDLSLTFRSSAKSHRARECRHLGVYLCNIIQECLKCWRFLKQPPSEFLALPNWDYKHSPRDLSTVFPFASASTAPINYWSRDPTHAVGPRMSLLPPCTHCYTQLLVPRRSYISYYLTERLNPFMSSHRPCMKHSTVVYLYYRAEINEKHLNIIMKVTLHVHVDNFWTSANTLFWLKWVEKSISLTTGENMYMSIL